MISLKNNLKIDQSKDKGPSSLARNCGEVLSSSFKLWVVGIIFSLVFLQLYASLTFPDVVIIPKELLLGVVLALIVYVWIQELRDKELLRSMNRALLDAQFSLQEAEIDAIAALVKSEEAKDPYVRGHSQRVAQYSVAIAREMNLPKEKIRIIERSGILHDLGKIGITDQILQKPGPLNEDEWKVMKRHPQMAVDILQPLKFLTEEKDIVLHHHERLDGQGYPDGLKAEHIPLESRIMAVSDTFDAMNSERAYRKPLAHEIILAELRKVAGAQLDPGIVRVFINLLETNPRLWEKE